MTMPQEAVDQFVADATHDWEPLSDDDLFRVGDVIRSMRLSPENVQYTPGVVALLGAARRLYATAMIQREEMALIRRGIEEGASDDQA